MAKYYIFLVILFLNNIITLSQNQQSIVVQSTVLDSVSKETLAYVNIGIADKNIGTVSNPNGEFCLALPDSLANENVMFSMIGYSNKQVSVRELQAGDGNILLSPSVVELDATEIISNKLKTKKTGNKHGGGVTLAVNALNAGGEIGTVVKIPHNKSSFLKDFNLKISANNPDSAVFRLNLYYIEDEGFVNILNDNIYFTLFKGDIGDVCVDLTPYQIFVDRDIFASIELLEIYVPDVRFEENDINRFFYDRINISGCLMGSKSYKRQTSQGKWTKIQKSVTPCFWITILY